MGTTIDKRTPRITINVLSNIVVLVVPKKERKNNTCVHGTSEAKILESQFAMTRGGMIRALS